MTKAEHRTFNWQVRVYWQDTDAGGIVYHPAYLNFAQRARSEFMREHVCRESDVLEKFGVLLVVRHAEISYRSPARLDDLLDVSVEVIKVGNSSLTLLQQIRRGEVILADVTITIVAISPEGRAVRLPPQLRQIFAS